MKLQTLVSIVLVIFSLLIPQAFSKKIKFLTISDIHLNHQQTHKMEMAPSGYNATNDMDNQTFGQLSSLIRRNVGAQKLISKPEFILYLGDIVGHKRASNPTRFVQDNTKKALAGLQSMFPDTPIINVFGNNDSFEKNYGAFFSDGLSPYKVALQSGFKNGFLSTGIKCHLKGKSDFPCIQSQNDKHGFFTIKLGDTLILIGLNSVMFSPKHVAPLEHIQLQMEYLKKQLKHAKKENTSVLIAMHIPVGNNVYDGSGFWNKSYQEQFLKIMHDYYKQIKGILAAHTHMDEFKIIRMPENQNMGEYLTAGLSTAHGNFPSIKVFTMNDSGQKWSISNYSTYQIHQIKSQLHIDKYYDFVGAYCKNRPDVIDINTCLSHITFNDILSRYTVNNPNYPLYKAQSPESFYVN